MGAATTTGQPAGPVTTTTTAPRPTSAQAAQALTWGLVAVALLALAVVEWTRPVAEPVAAVAADSFLSAEAVQRATEFRQPLRWASLLSLLLRMGVAGAGMWWLHRRRASQPRASRWRRCLGAAAIASALWAATDVVRFPLQAWAWSRSADVGLSTQTFWQWARDWLIEAGPYWLGVGICVAVAVWLAERLPRLWVPVAGLLGGLVGVVMILISPLLFEPLLLSFTPLPEGPLRQDILDLVAAAEEGDSPVRADLLVADASRRTTASNAYVSGIGGTRRIVLYDTLLADAPDEEVLAIVAHELAHDRNGDLERTAVSLMALSVLLVAAVGWKLGDRLPPPGGRIDPRTAGIAVALVILLLAGLGPLERGVSRRSESAADAGALALTGDPAAYTAMMTGLAERNLSDPDPPGWYVTLFHSHPPIGQRIARAQQEG
ncbi:MAG TPA: M48 family metalloprotease [Euzebya sp.]|nr:M48 family metalloprotease [Euzebya sp.]